MPQAIIVDDDDLFRESLSHNLLDLDFQVMDFSNGRAAIDYLASTEDRPDVILLDWKMPEMNGIEVLKALRSRQLDVPVIFLTVLGDQIYEEAALAGGAVDFIEKSRSFTILRKRIELVIARSSDNAGAVTTGEEPGHLAVGPLSLNLKSHRAQWRGREVDLSVTEFKMVHLMASRPGEDVSYRELYDLVHGQGFHSGYGAEGYRGNIRTFIKRIREKFRRLDCDFAHIENYPGFGYRWRDPERQD